MEFLIKNIPPLKIVHQKSKPSTCKLTSSIPKVHYVSAPAPFRHVTILLNLSYMTRQIEQVESAGYRTKQKYNAEIQTPALQGHLAQNKNHPQLAALVSN